MAGKNEKGGKKAEIFGKRNLEKRKCAEGVIGKTSKKRRDFPGGKLKEVAEKCYGEERRTRT